MSFTVVPLGVIHLLEQHGLLGGDTAIRDFGSMEFDSRVPENNRLFESLFERRGSTVPSEFYDGETGRLYGTAGDLYRALGWSYGSFDIDGRFGSTVVDLNVDAIPEAERGQATLTMNIGTSEHVFNQLNFFKQFHDVTSVGGLMLHVVPFHDYHNHGLYSYEPTFFYSLAQYNGYDVLGQWHVSKTGFDVYRSSSVRPKGRRIPLITLMRRTRNDAFAMPLQVNEPMVLSAGATNRYGEFSRQPLEGLRPTGDLPVDFQIDPQTGLVTDGPPAMPSALQEGKARLKARAQDRATMKAKGRKPPSLRHKVARALGRR